jgi:YHS domain-containing protein/TusA-related sulfurtransferase
MTNKKILVLLGVAALAAVLALAQAKPDTAKDPVCGMTVKTAGAKYTYDYKGTTFYFCSEGCKTAFAENPDKYLPQAAATTASQQQADTAIDPVCGMTVKKAGAKYTYDYKGMTYYFCSEGCKTSFSKEPEKYLKPADVAKPMGQGMGMGRGMMGQKMPHMQAAGDQPQAAMDMANCPMMMKDVEKTVANTADGATITLSSKNPETVKKIQEWAAKVKSGEIGKMDEASCPMGANGPMKKK